jgi:hypothetical protein
MKRVRHNPFAVMMTDPDGEWDVGNVGLFALLVIIIGAIPIMIVMSLFHYDVQPLGIAIGAVCAGFATALGALAAFRRSTDYPPPRPIDQQQNVIMPPKPPGQAPAEATQYHAA